jgi:L-amino acid N-acyltransferase YncA
MPLFDPDQIPRTGRRGRTRPATKVRVRPVEAGELAQVIALDAEVTGVEKADYWYEVFHRYGSRGATQRFFLVAESAGAVLGFVVGEVRDWEFGAAPCGWVFGINVRPDARLAGVGTKLLDAICAGFRRAGMTKVRTMLARDNNLVLSFFRSQGMMAAPFIPLEMDL